MDRLHAGTGTAPFDIPGLRESGDGTPLEARALTLDDDRRRVCIISGAYIGLFGSDAETVNEAVCEATGLEPEQMLIAGTHIHSGAQTLTGDAQQREVHVSHIARACAEAARQSQELRDARMGIATEHLPGVSRVRRILRSNGKVITLRRAEPENWGWATDPETDGPEEELDDLLTVVRIEDDEGEPFAAIMHFTSHPIPDFFGWATRLVEQNMHGLTCLALNGCFGSVDTPFEVPMRGRTQADQLPALGDILGYRTLELLARAETSNRGRVSSARCEVFLPFARRFKDNPMSRSEMWAEALEEGGLLAEVVCVALGDLALAGVPGEPQVGFGRDIAEVSPYPLTRGVGNADECCAYMLRPDARARGGYEADPTQWGIVGDESLQVVLDAIDRSLETMYADTEETGDDA